MTEGCTTRRHYGNRFFNTLRHFFREIAMFMRYDPTISDTLRTHTCFDDTALIIFSNFCIDKDILRKSSGVFSEQFYERQLVLISKLRKLIIILIVHFTRGKKRTTCQMGFQ